MAAGGKHLVVQIYCKITNKPALAKYLSDFLKQKTGKWSRGERCISLSHLSHLSHFVPLVPFCPTCPTCPTLSHLSHFVPLVPLVPLVPPVGHGTKWDNFRFYIKVAVFAIFRYQPIVTL